MTPTTFNEANAVYGPPADLDESQCQSIPAYQGTVLGGSVDGCKVVVVAWKPCEGDLERIMLGYPIFISMMGGLAPHFLTTDFQQATNPA